MKKKVLKFSQALLFSTKIGALILTIFLASCSKSHYIDVRSQYLDKHYLGSEQINTPDPLRSCFIGQKVVVKWRLPVCYRTSKNLELDFSIRYGNHELDHFRFPINTHRGEWEYYLVGEDYCTKRGMSAYKVKIFSEGEEIAKWTHHIWVEIVEIEAD